MSQQSNKGDKKKLKLRKLKAKLAERDKQHARGIMEVSRAIQRDFERKAEELVTFVASLPESNNLGDSAFTFARNRALAVRAEKIIQELNATTTKRILATIRNAERLSAEKYQSILDVYKVSEATFSSIITPDYTRELSKRVWAIGEQFGKEMELAIDTALLNGTSAADLSREVRGLLKEPHKLFRRVRDKRGELQLSKAARAYKPGQGVYRSSFKNAMRLASTETNISYRSSDYERWNALDFVQGIEIDLSNNHPVYDICDELKGRYPKDFKFVGWHPHCRCIATPILPDPDRFEKYYLGEADTASDSEDDVTEMPKNFKQWEKANAGRIAKAELKGKLPYFLRDNPHRRSKGKGAIRKEEEGKQKDPKRVRTEKERKEIQQRWDERRKLHAYADELPTNIGERERYAIARNNIEIEKALGITKGKPMTIDEADKQSANPNYQPEYIRDDLGRYRDKYDGLRYSLNPNYRENRDKPYQINCQTCVPAFELRRRGFDLWAKGKTKGSLSEYIAKGRSFELWKNTDGSNPKPSYIGEWMDRNEYKRMTPKRYRDFFEEACKEEGTYVLTIAWKGGGAHATVLQRTKKGELIHIEPQVDNSSNRLAGVDRLCNKGTTTPRRSRGILRIDNKIFNTNYLSMFNTPSLE